jgi:hypothetical protein
MRLTPRSAVALADPELLRVARTDIAPATVAGPTLSARLQALKARLVRERARSET